MHKIKNKSVQLSLIRKSPLHWDRYVDETAVEEMADSVTRHGLLHPLIVRPKGKLYEYIAGDIRYRGLRKAGEKRARVTVVECDDAMAEEISLVENLKTKKPTTEEWKEGIRRLAELEKKKKPYSDSPIPERIGPGRKPTVDSETNKKVAKAVGVSPKVIDRIVGQENLISTARKALEDKRITEQQATKLAKLTDEEQRDQLTLMVRETQKQTADRLRGEKLKVPDLDPSKKSAVKSFLTVLNHCADLQETVDTFRRGLTDESLSVLAKGNWEDLKKLNDTLTDFIQDIQTVNSAWR